MPAPGQYYPRSSGRHRIACIALYRSLLEQCMRVPLPADLPPRGPVNPMKHLIRKKFKQNAHHASSRLILPALQAGYAAEGLIHAASTGDQPALSRIHALLRSMHARYVAARAACTQPAPSELAQHRASLRAVAGAPLVVETRPLPLAQMSRVRHVPTLTMATWLPFLRFKKRQPPYLTRVLTSKIRQKQTRMVRLAEAELAEEMADAETRWEELVLAQAEEELGPKGALAFYREGWGDGDRCSWRTVSEQHRWLLGKRIEREYARTQALADRMMDIVKREKELWAEEKIARKRASRARRKANQSLVKEERETAAKDDAQKGASA